MCTGPGLVIADTVLGAQIYQSGEDVLVDIWGLRTTQAGARTGAYFEPAGRNLLANLLWPPSTPAR